MPSWTELLLIAFVVILLFGTKRLRNIGSDLGSALKGFKKAMSDDEAPTSHLADKSPEQGSGEPQKKAQDEQKTE